MSGTVLPNLRWVPTQAKGDRRGAKVTHVVVHRWGVKYVDEGEEASSYEGVVRYFQNPANQASSHLVFPGSAVPGQCTQMVGWDSYAWTEAAYNPTSDEIECADAIWLGHDPEGLAILARIVAFRLHVRGLPAVWSHETGFCRHADLGAAGGGHLECPTVDLVVWKHFVSLVQMEIDRGGFRPKWGWD